MDSIGINERWDIDLGVRVDRFNSYFSEAYSGSSFSRSDTDISPRIAAIYKPNSSQSYYFSYGTSYNPAIEYLTLAPTSASLSPEKNSTVELGGKLQVLQNRMTLTGALFEATLTNARIADPGDPTTQSASFSQRVRGLELGADGHLGKHWEIKAGYTHLDDRLTATTATDGSQVPGLRVPNIPTDSANLWAVYEQGHQWEIGGGFNYMSQRFADFGNTASVPSYVVFNGMASYRVNEHMNLQLNVNNLTNKLYYSSLYYADTDENHAVPGPGRTAMLTASIRY
jgi:catecholate siderophore receptor